jgi:hypothetical protein
MTTHVLQPDTGMLLGSLRFEPKDVVLLLEKEINEDAVREHLKSLNPSYKGDPRKANRGWKEVIFGRLEGLVEECGGRAVSTKSEKQEREFILDFVGLEEKNGAAFSRAILSVECEWWKGREELLRNFRKLLVFKAPLKMLIYSCLDGCSGEERAVERDQLRGCLKNFEQHLTGESYLLIEFYEEKRNDPWKQEARIWHAEQVGAVQEVKFLLWRQEALVWDAE